MRDWDLETEGHHRTMVVWLAEVCQFCHHQICHRLAIAMQNGRILKGLGFGNTLAESGRQFQLSRNFTVVTMPNRCINREVTKNNTIAPF